MNWYKNGQVDSKIFYHATVPILADNIIEMGVIVPGLDTREQTGRDLSGWNFSQNSGRQYGEGIYLAKDRSLALYYAELRLKKEWEEIEHVEDLLSEDYGFLALFKVYVNNLDKLIQEDQQEFVYLGKITKDFNSDAWFEKPEWIDYTKQRDMFIKKQEDIYNELVQAKQFE